MIELIQILFPLKFQLNILQLEEYKSMRFLNWNFKNPLKRNIPTKKPLVYTTKLKNIILIYIILCIIAFLINPFLFILFIIEPFIPLILSINILKPYEIYNKKITIEKTKNKILSYKNLKVIGITGSFGKTSTKEILYQILKNKYSVLRTPESFNTIFGISKVVDYELDNSYEIFICEMAAYKMGEIKTLCEMVPPEFGILTGITTQHFERFGSLANTIKAKFELIDAIKDKEKIVFNLEDSNISNEIRKRNIKINKNKILAKNISFNKNGTLFYLEINNKAYKLNTPLFGFANIKNIVIASNMALKLGMNLEEILSAIKNLKPFDSRNVLIHDSSATIVNNTYSSNIQSFKETIETAKKVRGKKVLVTPGIVELGKLEIETHKNLGNLSKDVFDKIILVGKNNRTESLAKGLEKNFEFVKDNREDYFKKLEDLKNKYDWIFLENDLTQNY